MAIFLLSHNETACLAAASMLAETDRAAIIHPTGTGKSFIGFRLCEDNPNCTICWLAPSEYFFQTRMENLAATGANSPQIIVFYTYAKLMLMEDEELRAI